MDPSQQQMHHHLARALMHLNHLASFFPFFNPILIGNQTLHPFQVPTLPLLHDTSIRSFHCQVLRHRLPLQLTEKNYLPRWCLMLSHTFGPSHTQLHQKRCHHLPPSSTDQMAQEPFILEILSTSEHGRLHHQRRTVCLPHLLSILNKPPRRHILTFALQNSAHCHNDGNTSSVWGSSS